MSEKNFKKGQKVVLERDFDPETRASAPGDNVTLPELGQVYTVYTVADVTGFGEVLFLEEIENPSKFYFDASLIMEQGFDPTRFRAVTRHNPAPLSLEAVSAWCATVAPIPVVEDMSSDDHLSVDEIDAINRRWARLQSGPMKTSDLFPVSPDNRMTDFFKDLPVVDPVQEVEAALKAINDGYITRGQAVAQFGLDVEEVDAENARDKARLAAMDGGAA